MATAFTTLLGYALPTTGELDGIWGDEVNNSITQLVEDSVAGYASHDMTAADWTLTTTGSGLSNEARMMVLITSGTPGVSRNIIAPAHSKMYVVVNKSDASVVLKGASTTGATVGAGYTAVVVWNGSDFEEISPTLAKYAIDLIGGVQGSIPYQTAVNTTALLAPGTTGQVLTSQGAGAAPTWTNAATGDVTLTGVQTLTNKTIEAGVFSNGYTEETATANTSTAYTIDLANGSVQILTLTGNCTFTFPTATAGKSFMLLLKQDATGSRTVTWPASVKWPSSTAPTITSTASKGDKYVFTSDGTYWWGSTAGQNYL